MGALEECEAAGAAHLAGMVIRAPNGARIRGEFAAAHGFRAFRDRGLALPRTVLDSILLNRARAAGAEVFEGEHVISVLRDSRGAVCGVRARSEALGTRAHSRARLVIGADGLRSTIARRMGVNRHALGSATARPPSAPSQRRRDHALREQRTWRAMATGIAELLGHGLTPNVARVSPKSASRRARERSRPSGGLPRAAARGAGHRVRPAWRARAARPCARARPGRSRCTPRARWARRRARG